MDSVNECKGQNPVQSAAKIKMCSRKKAPGSEGEQIKKRKRMTV